MPVTRKPSLDEIEQRMNHARYLRAVAFHHLIRLVRRHLSRALHRTLTRAGRRRPAQQALMELTDLSNSALKDLGLRKGGIFTIPWPVADPIERVHFSDLEPPSPSEGAANARAGRCIGKISP